jgi:glycosyltransferase involved in cell wall biosynthesis
VLIRLVLSDLVGSVGGIARFGRLLVEAAREFVVERGELEVFALVDSPSSPLPEWLEGVRYFPSARSRRTHVLRLVAAASRRRADLCLVGHLNQVVLGPIAAGKYGVMLYGIEAWSRRSRMIRGALKRAQGLVGITQHTLRGATAANGLSPAQPRFVLPCALDPDFELASPAPGRDDVVRLLSTSRLTRGDRYKGIDETLAAVARLAASGLRLRYTIVGDGDDRPRLERLATSLGIGELVTFRGRVSDAELASEVASCDLFVLPSANEGFGIVYLEAMARSKPVIAARAGGAPEVVLDGETGVLVPPFDARALADAIQLLARDASLRVRLGEAGRARLDANFRYAQFRERAFEIFEALLKAPSPVAARRTETAMEGA